jgi:hypothetical protein
VSGFGVWAQALVASTARTRMLRSFRKYFIR